MQVSMPEVRPTSEQELREILTAAAAARHPIALEGAGSKRDMSRGPASEAAIKVSVACLRRVIEYEPRDLTISVEAGLPFAELSALLAEHRQMIPLDPPFFNRATVGGVVAANTNGPRRRLYGTVRDFVIGMSFVTLDGKLAKSGGMVVKNVAGFDMAKLMIGSFGTLAAMTVVNFKIAPMPVETRTFVTRFDSAAECIAARDALLDSVLQPLALDILNPQASVRVGLSGFALVVQAGGNPAVLGRYAREFPGAESLDGEGEKVLWEAIREFTPAWLADHPGAHVIRVSATLTQTGDLIGAPAAVVARAGSGPAYLHFSGGEEARMWMSSPEATGFRYATEYGEPASCGVFGSDLPVMKSVKKLFDPHGLLNAGRLYGCI
jgi:glycolate oxidase FAD binding subunit